MKLRSVEMVGFKSFRDRVEIEISDTITCIVGPNGCGKSNVVDAIKWAMGEMSPTSLRGDSLSDVIFAGTEKRRPAGMAEVTLTFDNSDSQGEFPADTAGEIGGESDGEFDLGEGVPRQFRNLSEIAITRRLHQSGESEYLINKVQCRLRDIRNLLAGTGLGKQGYSIIEQGQIGFIVNARPSERRLIIEEASGITRYKDRRKRAARKLDRTRQNLQRTRDILEEIEARKETLKSQAEKARRHRDLTEELEKLKVAVLVDRHREAVDEHKQLAEKLKAANESIGEIEERLQKTQKQLERARKNVDEAEKRHEDLTENYYGLRTQLDLSRSNKKHALETAEQAADRREELEQERTRQGERRNHLSEELKTTRSELEQVARRPEDALEAIAELESTLESLQSERADIAGQRRKLRKLVEQRHTRAQRIDDRLEWTDEKARELVRRRRELGEELEELQAERADVESAVDRLAGECDGADEEAEEAQTECRRLEEKLDRAETSLSELRSREEQIARRMMELDTRIESLEEMKRRGEGYDQGVRRVLEWAEQTGRDDVYGPVGDFLRVPEGQAAAYAAYLGTRLEDVVVESRKTALQALQMLSEEDAGRVGCLPLGKGVEDPAEEIDGWTEEFEVVDDLRRAPELDASPPSTDQSTGGWATPEGDVIYADGRVVGGGTGDRGETALRQARQLEELREKRANVDDEHRQAAEDVDIATERVESLRQKLEDARTEAGQAKHRARGLHQDLEAERREGARLADRIERIRQKRDQLQQEHQEVLAERQRLEDEREDLRVDLPERRDELQRLEDAIDELNERIEENNDELTEHKVQVAQIDERRSHLERNVERLEREITEATKRRRELADEIAEQKTRKKEAQMRAETLAAKIERLASDHGSLGEEVQEAKKQLSKLNDRVESLELKGLSHRRDLEEAREKAQKLEMARREVEIEAEHIVEQLGNQYGIDLEEADRRAADVELDPKVRRERTEKLERELRKLGEVNLLAIEEYEESKERYEFHAEQQSDLEESVADLEAAIDRMDRESRKRFKETFEAVNERFQTVFPRLFQGGKARLILTEPDDILETGVDIEAQPPGKKLQNVNLLSGGEKALTAVSLIFSIFTLKPSPFAILDEVDAPLDDANVERFAEMVTELSEKSQMILITHNRRTMEAPELLYGVTMEEAGVSKLVSVKLSEVDERLAS